MKKAIAVAIMVTLIASVFIGYAYALTEKEKNDIYTITDSALPFLDKDSVYLVGGYFTKDSKKTFFTVEINKPENKLTILCKQVSDTKDNGVYCYDAVIKKTDPETQQTYQDEKMLIIFGVLSTTKIPEEPQQPEQPEQPQQPREEQTRIEDGDAVYVQGAGLVAKKTNDGITYYHQDYLSSNRFSTNSNEELSGKSVFYPYGATLSDDSEKSASTNYKFTGKENDDGLYYYGARYYDASTARFLSIDPIFDATTTGYAYAANNPLRYTDPTGEYVIDAVTYAINPGLKKQKIIDFVELAKKLSPATAKANGEYGHTYPSILVNPAIRNSGDRQASYDQDPNFDALINTGGLSVFDRIFYNEGKEGRMTLSGVTTYDELAEFVHESVHRLQHTENRFVLSYTEDVHDALFAPITGFYHTLDIATLRSSLTIDELNTARLAISNEIEAQQEAYNTLLRAQNTAPQELPRLTDALKEHKDILDRLQEVGSLMSSP